MRYDKIYITPESPPVAKYDKPPVPNFPWLPEEQYYIIPSYNDELCGHALRKQNNAKHMLDGINYIKNMRKDTVAAFVEQCKRMALLEQEKNRHTCYITCTLVF